ncbi:MAG: Mce-associated rane protein [Mycobacterium sp.]|nr:Mce-associated rane protein [Mycobacterium sp.]
MTDEEKTTVIDEAEESKVDSDSKDVIEDAADDADADADAADDADTADAVKAKRTAKPFRPGIDWPRVFAYGVLPGLALVLALAAGFLKYVDNSVRSSDVARAESMQVAKDSTIALLSYQPDKVKDQLNAARSLLTGDFQNSYTSLINDVVIPGAEQKKISAVATVPAAASVSAQPNHAVVLVFVNQTVIVGADAPTDTASSVKVTLDKHGDKWLISEFQPV